ncbi:MAG: DUF4097 domain-containing protein [Erysipelotrichaceae bacterium]|nr:DUF4097 domain-containing protein [Erysipelotrichaceae bacterium]
MKKKFLVCVIFLFILSLSSCNIIKKYSKYSDSYKYHVLNDSGETYNNTVTNIDIDWISGKVVVEQTDKYDGVTVIEKLNSGPKKNNYLCHVFHDYSDLSIKYCASNISLPAVDKDLYVYLPENMNFSELKISMVSGSIIILGGNIKEIEIDSVSSSTKIDNTIFEELSFDSVSGNLNCKLTNATKNIEFDSVSGSVILALPSDVSGFKVKLDSISGMLVSSDFGLQIKNNGVYSYLDERIIIDVETNSGNLTLVKYSIASE